MAENEQAKAYELRDLCADDVFPMFNIISKIGVKEFKSVFDSDSIKNEIAKTMQEASVDENSDAESKEKAKNKAVVSIGISFVMEIAGIVIANIGKCKEDIYQFLSSLSGMSKKEIAALPMKTFINMIFDVFKKEEFKDFFQAVSELFKSVT